MSKGQSRKTTKSQEIMNIRAEVSEIETRNKLLIIKLVADFLKDKINKLFAK